MGKLMNILMITCEKSTELIEKKTYFSLNTMEKIQLYMHTQMCDACKSWQKHSKELDSTLKNHFTTTHTDDNDNQEGLSEKEKETILRKLKE